MSADVHEKFLIKEEKAVYRYCDGNLSFSATNNDEDYNCNKKKMSRDPMSHRIIEKRRRDRMNNCLADLSRLIPPEYLKKGRGRIEKTEIIEMAIKHMRHLQSIIASARFNENSENSVPSPPATSTASRDTSTFVGEQPIIVEHYRLGYLECLSEAMHFLVEVQGYFAGDSLCVQMINHLHKHCDKILKGNTLNLSKKHSGREVGGSESSTSPANGTFHDGLPLGMSMSVGSPSDDNQLNQNFEPVKHFEGSRNLQGESPKRYQETGFCKKSSDGCCPKYQESEGIESENRSDSELRQSFVSKCKNNEIGKDESKGYLNNFETGANFGVRSYPMPNGHYVGPENGNGFENLAVKEETGNGPSQLREMLTSPSSVCNQVNGHSHRSTAESKGSTSPTYPSGCESNPGIKSSVPKSVCYKSQEGNEGSPEFSEGSPPDNHHMMYKFKNNIKQRFSKEKECEVNSELPLKKSKAAEDFLKYPDPLMKERLNLLDRTDVEDEKVFKINPDFEMKKRIRYGSESEIQDGSDISNRLSFGHKSNEKIKRWEEPLPCVPYGGSSKLWALSPNAPLPFFASQQATPGAKLPARQLPELSSALNNSFHSMPLPTSPHPGIPIFALHAKGSFYVPLTLDQATLAPFLTLLGITKTDERTDDKTVLHPVTISDPRNRSSNPSGSVLLHRKKHL